MACCLILVAHAQERPEEQGDVAPSDVELQAAQSKEVAEYWVEEGYKELQGGKASRAMKAFQDALALDDQNHRALFGIGTAYIQMQEFRKALDVLEDLSRKYPKDYSLLNNIAWLYATSEDHSVRNGVKAVKAAQDALLLAPSDYHVWSTLAEAYYVSGKYEKALRCAEEAVELGKQKRAPMKDMRDYRKQIGKSKRAAEAMSLMD